MAVDGLFGFYHCPATRGGCGHFFNLQLLNIVRHTPADLLAMARWFTQAAMATEPSPHPQLPSAEPVSEPERTGGA